MTVNGKRTDMAVKYGAGANLCVRPFPLSPFPFSFSPFRFTFFLFHFSLFILPILCWSLSAEAQPISGTTGLLNIPTAEMQRDGTVIAGLNHLPEAMTPSSFDYNTANYYLNITFLPFFEFSYRMTLLQMPGGTWNQDRSFAMRFRLTRERKHIPSLVVGGNDLYSSSGRQSGYFNALYAVASKNITIRKIYLNCTMGYAHQGSGKVRQGNLKGLFGGTAVSYADLPGLQLMAEYDSQALNAGASLLLFRHLKLFGLLYDMHTPAGGIALLVNLN